MLEHAGRGPISHTPLSVFEGAILTPHLSYSYQRNLCAVAILDQQSPIQSERCGPFYVILKFVWG